LAGRAGLRDFDLDTSSAQPLQRGAKQFGASSPARSRIHNRQERFAHADSFIQIRRSGFV
jgi:type IV secretory pathway TrbL component